MNLIYIGSVYQLAQIKKASVPHPPGLPLHRHHISIFQVLPLLALFTLVAFSISRPLFATIKPYQNSIWFTLISLY